MQTSKTLEWMENSEQPGGGLSAWQMENGNWHKPYIEVSGYSIPTLFKWGADEVACRVADWLLSVQNSDGSFNGLDGVPRPFDTSAVVEGLEYAYRRTRFAMYRDSANRASRWIMTQLHEGHIKNNPSSNEANIYQLRTASIIGHKGELEYWRKQKLIHIKERSHYLAYALEGMLEFGEVDAVKEYLGIAYDNLLQPYYVDRDWRAVVPDFDFCASAQMALLFHRVGWDAQPHYDAIMRYIKNDGGVPQSSSDNRSILWAARYLLELQYAIEKG